MINGSVVSEELRLQDFGTDGQSDCTPRPVLAFGDAGKKKNQKYFQTRGALQSWIHLCVILVNRNATMPIHELQAIVFQYFLHFPTAHPIFPFNTL